MNIRMAVPDDAAALLAIYRPYVYTAVTFEYEAPDEKEFRRRIADTLKHHPYIVAVENGVPVGYAYANRIRPRAAYQWGVELSVYVAEKCTGRGIGIRLYSTLLCLLEHQNVRTAYGCVTMPNPASEQLHEKLGFRQIGLFRNAGFKNGAWHNVAWFEKRLAENDLPPEPLTPVAELNKFLTGDQP